MPKGRPFSDLRNKANEPEFCREFDEQARKQALIRLCAKLSEAEADTACGDKGEDFLEAARKLKERVLL